MYRGETYDPTVDYFGPQGHWLSDFIPKIPPSLRDCSDLIQEAVRRGVNHAAWKHDVDYGQRKEVGLLGKVVNAFKRRAADLRFLRNMEGAILAVDGLISDDEIDDAIDYAETAYRAVRIFGVAFYGGKIDEN